MYADLQGVPKEGRTTLQAAMNPAEKSLKPCRNSLRTPWKISEPCKEHKMCYSGGRFTSAQRVTSILRYDRTYPHVVFQQLQAAVGPMYCRSDTYFIEKKLVYRTYTYRRGREGEPPPHVASEPYFTYLRQ